jgi:hypothetical protein
MSEFDLPKSEIVARLSQEERLKRIGAPIGLTPRQANAVTQARLQLALSELADGNIANVQLWLEQVGQRAPAEAIRLFMELLEFRLPRMKAAQVNLNATIEGKERGLKDMTIEELERVVAEQ